MVHRRGWRREDEAAWRHLTLCLPSFLARHVGLPFGCACSTIPCLPCAHLSRSTLPQIGLNPDRVRFRQHLQHEMAHYAEDCWDFEVECSYGWVECSGLADRSAYDLNVSAGRGKRPGEQAAPCSVLQTITARRFLSQTCPPLSLTPHLPHNTHHHLHTLAPTPPSAGAHHDEQG